MKVVRCRLSRDRMTGVVSRGCMRACVRKREGCRLFKARTSVLWSADGSDTRGKSR